MVKRNFVYNQIIVFAPNKEPGVTHRCLADIGGPFYSSAKPFRNWSALPFYQLDLAQPPYVDQEQLAQGIVRAQLYLDRVHAQGYTGIVIDNLAHLITFERAPLALYPADSPYRLRALIYRAAFGQLFEQAARLGMEVFVTTDMQWSTPPMHEVGFEMLQVGGDADLRRRKFQLGVKWKWNALQPHDLRASVACRRIVWGEQ